MFPPSRILKGIICKGKVTPVKRLRESCDEGNTAAPRGFDALPMEVQMRIVELACHPATTSVASHDPASSEAAALATITSSAVLDIPTALNLALVSREIYSEVVSILYTNICITRPSSLTRLQQTLAARPALGRIVRSLHLGPLSGSADSWEPMINNLMGTGRGPRTSGIAGSRPIDPPKPPPRCVRCFAPGGRSNFG